MFPFLLLMRNNVVCAALRQHRQEQGALHAVSGADTHVGTPVSDGEAKEKGRLSDQKHSPKSRRGQRDKRARNFA